MGVSRRPYLKAEREIRGSSEVAQHLESESSRQVDADRAREIVLRSDVEVGENVGPVAFVRHLARGGVVRARSPAHARADGEHRPAREVETEKRREEDFETRIAHRVEA